MQKRKNRWYIAVAAVVILAVVLVLAVVLGKKGKNKKDPKMIEPTQQEQASEIPTETEEVFRYGDRRDKIASEVRCQQAGNSH